MAELSISPKLANRLSELARRQNRSVEALLTEWVEETEGSVVAPESAIEESNPLAHLGQRLAAADFHSGRSDTAERSREILEQEYGDYLLKRRGGQSDASTKDTD
jgi:hypothetical protein